MTIQFRPMRRIFSDIPQWGARLGNWSFVITNEDKTYQASAKAAPGNPFDGKTIYLGEDHHTFDDAKDACEAFIEARQ